ncbi:tRNA (N6-threonylcarbamoyladenosine(37)-N6)-methyltransferase TrmO [Prolixibacter sp. NT017]|uniref:tRNA (N6-threonylcarbamoyladenosine(37)-N6)-methyltransferase TrmO n=1 Tax=Prolixibacter sp. NT017 TaxID=2652390 RepID=UPI001279A492|nr:tRNA (N6-threonylcarbamoyladenosine(37)-N6)-methyltransferase TrmO [Prolixibacter sp. NT017]GET27339.1 tRNA (N6-threonylcarbamoyladenosine(37)-N6)-methyltransferase TrmO [Prolixibacter sp. NT017]
MSIALQPIGTIFTPFRSKEGMPIQSRLAKGIKGRIELKEKFVPGLLDLDGFSHIFLVYYFHESNGFELQVKPFLDDNKHGVFATRAPKRPNAIGMSVVKLLHVDKNILEVENVDMLDGTPLLDIKPYIPQFDDHQVERWGWVEDKENRMKDIQSDDRFDK